jgi:replication-associated recombination protein RarA
MTDTIDTAWSPQQEIALADFSSWYESQVWAHRDENQIFRLFGFAGTGKTTLAKHLASDIEDVVFCSFTGKAALVLRQKGLATPGQFTV